MRIRKQDQAARIKELEAEVARLRQLLTLGLRAIRTSSVTFEEWSAIRRSIEAELDADPETSETGPLM